MMNRYAKILFILFLCFAAIGCASSQKTYVSEVTDGKAVPGESAGYIYQLLRKANTNTYLLSKRKYCFEEMEKIAHERKRSQDVSGAATTVLLPLGIVFPRIGQPLLDTGFEKSRGEKTEKIGKVKTGRIVSCGEYVPAPGEKIVLMTSESKVIRNIQSNANGVIDLSNVVSSEKNAIYVNLFIKQVGSAYFVATTYIQ
jgi:hypothetical protein